MYKGTSAQMNVMKGCCATAVKRLGWVTAKPAPSMVTMMLAKTSAYVRRTSVARSTPLRMGNVLTAGLYEKPMASSDSVGEFDENIYPAASRKSRRWSAAWTGRDQMRRLRWRWRTGRGCLLWCVLGGPLEQRNVAIHGLEHDFS